MKQCLNCNGTYPSIDNTCHSCGFSCAIIDDFPAYAPLSAQEGTGFKSSCFADLAKLESTNFWFRARNRLIIWAIGRYYPNLQSFLEIGCGTGYVLSGIAKAYPYISLQGSELFTEGLSYAAARMPFVNLMQMDARYIPFIEEFDSIGVFDVLEHIEEDTQVLSQIHQALKPQGVCFITVPQHKWLWSPVDDYACHVRRYSAKELHTKLTARGFEILQSTSFVSSLLPAMLASRIIQKFKSKKKFNPRAELKISPWINTLFEKILNMEIRFIRRGINFPLGGSRLVVARKISKITPNQ